jgi:hypothetical protein
MIPAPTDDNESKGKEGRASIYVKTREGKSKHLLASGMNEDPVRLRRLLDIAEQQTAYSRLNECNDDVMSFHVH